MTQIFKTNSGDYATLTLRIAAGVMFLAHGLMKLIIFTPAGTAEFFASVGFPPFLGYATMTFEIVAGILLMIGFASRWVSLLGIGVMLGAATVHMGNGWVFSNPGGGWEFPVYSAATLLALVFLGDGKFSVANVLNHKNK